MSENSDYQSTQNLRDGEYLQQYDHWLSTATDEEKAKIRAFGLDKASLDSFSILSNIQDSNDVKTVEASICPSENDNDLDVSEIVTNIRTSAMSMFIAWLLDDENPLLKIWSVAFALNLSCVHGVYPARKARALGFTKAAMSKRIIKFKRDFGIRTAAMRSGSACNSCRSAQKTNHHRYQKIIETAKQNHETN